MRAAWRRGAARDEWNIQNVEKQRPKKHRRQTSQGASAAAAAADDRPLTALTPSRENVALAVRSRGVTGWLAAGALAVAVFLVYQPAWQGRFLWDDDGHVTKPALRSLSGLGRIWFDPGATQQYYPVVHTAFWVEHKLWGDCPLGYHLVNISLHFVTAVLVFHVLRYLRMPGAALAATIFALHPVQVESVAWITEMKNTLSAPFYVGAMLSYLHFDRKRENRDYAIACVLFVLSLLSKTVTATLPAALLVIFWCQRGRLSWKKDVLPLIPFFVLSAAGGMFTSWAERKLIGAEGPEFVFTAAERLLIAGRVVWFYFEKLFWPANLIFLYPRWHISQAVWWQYLYPGAAAFVLLAFWMIRRHTRIPLAALLFFGGTLFPVLGFFNVYPFLYSFVADHFQYLASLGAIVPVSAGVAWILQRAGRWPRAVGRATCLALLTTLAVLSWRQSRIYADVETLYNATIERNPACWMAHNNLGIILFGRGKHDEAIAHYQIVLQVRPGDEEVRNNLGLALAGRGQIDEAIVQYQKALETNCHHPHRVHCNLADALVRRGQIVAAIEHYRQALTIDPTFADAHNNLGIVLADQGQRDQAIAHYQKAVEIEPDRAEFQSNLGSALYSRGRIDEAIAHYRKAVEIRPDYAKAQNSLGSALFRQRRIEEAIVHYQSFVELKPGDANARCNLGSALAACGRLDEALVQFRKALEVAPDHAVAYYNLGNVFLGRGQTDEAVAEYRKALEIQPGLTEAQRRLAAILSQREKTLKHGGSEAGQNVGRAAVP